MGINILLGVAASIIFYPTQKYLLEWPYPWDLVSTGAVLVVTIGLASYLMRRKQSANKSQILSDIEAKSGMKARIDNLETKETPARVLSNLKVEGGHADFEIKDTKL